MALLLGALAEAQRPTRKPKNAPPPPHQWPAVPSVDAGAAWSQAMKVLLTRHAARHPELLFERRGSKLVQRRLGTIGAESATGWRRALCDVQAAQERFAVEGGERVAQAQQRALADWLEAERIQLDAQAVASADPASYVEHALRTLRAAQDAVWIAPEERLKNLAVLVAELPAYFRDARYSLITPTPPWIDLALADLDDLEALLVELEKILPPAPKAPEPPARNATPHATPGKPTPLAAGAPAKGGKPRAAAAPTTANAGKASAAKPSPARSISARPHPAPARESVDPRAALDAFRGWLLEQRPGAAGQPPRLDASEWTRVVQLTTGTELSAGELKARCLRDLARIDRDAAPAVARHKRALDPEDVVARSAIAAGRALALGQEARILKVRLSPQDVEFGLEESLRTDSALVRLSSGPAERVQALLQLPSHAWSVERSTTRTASLETRGLIALGVRHGLVGEALLTRALRDEKNPLIAMLANRAVREGFGLYALDWVARVDWVENPLLADAEALREFELQRGYEASRLLAALELHAESVSIEEASLSFARRTGVDQDTARAEVLAAERDPLRGIGWLGLQELRALEEKLAKATGPKRGLSLTLMLTRRHPELRTADIAASLGKGLRHTR
ncbi:MAG: hypothetical protein EXS08_12875 [Planctomycetes bacterium]|nr:hypothetical protein [Planctomycetota bacterium]